MAKQYPNGYTEKYTSGNASLDAVIERQSKKYNDAKAVGDVKGMRDANDAANMARNEYGFAAEYANDDIEQVKRQTGYGGGGSHGGGGYSGSGQRQEQPAAGQQDLYAQLLEEQRRQYAEIQAQQEAAKRAAVEQAVGQLNGQKTALNQSYEDLYRQLYLDRRTAEKSLPQQMAAMGISGGMTESTALGLQTSYADALRQGEQAKQGTLSGIDQAISNARLSGDISIAELAAQNAKDQLAAYGSTVGAMQQQQNWQNQFNYQQFLNDRDFNYQAGRDQVGDAQWEQSFDHNKYMDFQNLDRQQLVDEFNRSDIDYERKTAAAQYLYETTGDASLLGVLGYTPEQIAALGSSYNQRQAMSQPKGRGGGGRGGNGGGSYSDAGLASMVDRFNGGDHSDQVVQALLDSGGYTMDDLVANGYGAKGESYSPGYDSLTRKLSVMEDSIRGDRVPAKAMEMIRAALEAGSITEAEARKLLQQYGFSV